MTKKYLAFVATSMFLAVLVVAGLVFPTKEVSAQNCYNFTRSLGVGSSGDDVSRLIGFLSTEGLLSFRANTYDESVASAVTAFQEKYSSTILSPNGLSHGTGYFGNATRAKMNALYGCRTVSNTTPPPLPTSTITSDVCPAGFICSNPNITPTPKPIVTPSTYICPAGYICKPYDQNITVIYASPTPTPTSSSFICPTGYICGSTPITTPMPSPTATSFICPAGYICGSATITTPAPTTNSTSCPAGYSCCPAGYVCNNNNATYTTPSPALTNTNSVSFDQTNLKVMPGKAFTISGTNSPRKEFFTVALVGPGYTGRTDWNTVSNIVKSDVGMYTGVSNTISVYGSSWSVSFGGLVAEGYYTVIVYDGAYNEIGRTTLLVTYKG